MSFLANDSNNAENSAASLRNGPATTCWLALIGSEGEGSKLPIATPKDQYPPAREILERGVLRALFVSAVAAGILVAVLVAMILWGWIRKNIKIEWK